MHLVMNKNTYLKNRDEIQYALSLKWDTKEKKYLETNNEVYITVIEDHEIRIINFLKEVLKTWLKIYKESDGRVSSYEDTINNTLSIIEALKTNDTIFLYSKEIIKKKGNKIENIFGISISEEIDKYNIKLLSNITYPYSQLSRSKRPNNTIGAAGSNLRNYMVSYHFNTPYTKYIYSTTINEKAEKGLLSIGFVKNNLIY